MSAPSAAGRPNISRLIVPAVAIAFLLWAAVFIWRTSIVAIDGRRYFSLFDDAMISMRYAWNSAHGAGPVWNPGERVEGYTNPLMVLVMTAFCFLPDNRVAVVAVQFFGVFTVLATAWVTAILSGLLSDGPGLPAPRRIPWLVFAGVLAYYPLVFFSLMGMETGLAALLLATAACLAVMADRTGRLRYFVLLGVANGLMFLARPDTAIFAAVILLHGFIQARSSGRWRRESLQGSLIALAVFLAVAIGSRLLAYAYYGSLMPNTYLLKLDGVPLPVRLANGFAFIGHYISQTFPLLALCCAGMVIDTGRERWLLGLVPIFAVAYQVWVGGDPWPYWRIMASAYPLLLVTAVRTAEALARTAWHSSGERAFSRKHPRLASVPLVVAAVILVALGNANRSFVREIIGIAEPYSVGDNRNNVNIAVAIREITTDDATIGVFWAGAIPYYSGRRAIDFLGKNDSYIASLPPDLSGAVSWAGISSMPGHNKYDLQYSIGLLQPTYVQGLRWGLQDLTAWGESGRYIPVTYKGVFLLLWNGSRQVRWENLGTASIPASVTGNGWRTLYHKSRSIPLRL